MHEWPASSPERRSPEIQEADVVEALRSSDLLNCERYHLWRSQEEERVDAVGNRIEDNLDFALRDARIRRRSGHEDAAKLAYEEALELAEGLADSGQADAIRREMLGG
jgi:hypothetical protein